MKEQPISVLYFTNGLVRGGAEEHILTLLKGLDRKHFRPHLACTPEVASKLQRDLPNDVELLPLCLRKPSHLGSVLRLAKILRERRVEILHSHLFYSSLFASPIGWLCRVPVTIETPHIREHWRRGWKASFFLDRVISHFVDYYIAVSEANARYLLEQKRLPGKKIVVIHNGCDLERFDPARPAPAGLKKSLGFDESDPVLIIVGRLEPQKGHCVLLEALPAVRREFPRVRLVCVGEGTLRRQLEAQMCAQGLEDSVRFVGYQTNVAAWLALADVALLPSFYEGLPLVAIESLAAARPVVATAVDGTPEVVINGKTGLTVPPGDAARLAEAICRLLREPELRRGMGCAGRQWVLQRFSQEQQIQRTQEFYLYAWQQTKRVAKGELLEELAEGMPPTGDTMAAQTKWTPKWQ
jgi:glycosyltransferase involved in cell wall biosynthesis